MDGEKKVHRGASSLALNEADPQHPPGYKAIRTKAELLHFRGWSSAQWQCDRDVWGKRAWRRGGFVKW